MNEKRASLEVIAPSIEEAVAKGLGDLGLTEDAVDVEILDEGSKGLFGLGTRQARVRLTIKSHADGEAPVEAVGEDVVPAMPAEPDQGPVSDDAAIVDVDEDELATDEDEGLNEAQELILHVAHETVLELLERMGIDAEINVYFGERDDARSRVPVMVDINGQDLSILIGPQAETLNALQYIASLIVGKELGRSIPLVVDVEGYRVRRAQALQRLAHTMADQAIKSGRRQALEPMPANERRLVHIALREEPRVYTESVGEDPRRKVMIIPTSPEDSAENA